MGGVERNCKGHKRLQLITSSLIMACTRFLMLVKTPHIEEVGLGMSMLETLYATCKNRNKHKNII
jgi:hypothetical protein